jgi:hypothetical protein
MPRKAPGCAAWSHSCSVTGGLRRFIDISAVKLEAAAAEAPKVTSSHYCRSALLPLAVVLTRTVPYD